MYPNSEGVPKHGRDGGPSTEDTPHVTCTYHVVLSYGVVSLNKPDEVRGHEFCSLVNKLVEGVLAIGPRLAPHNRPRAGPAPWIKVPM